MSEFMTTAKMRDLLDSLDEREQIVGALHLFLNLHHELPWLSAKRLAGVNIISRPDSCLIVVKADGRKGAVVSFHDGDDIADALVNLATAVLWDAAIWREDKYRSMRSDE